MSERFKANARIPVRPLSMANADLAEIRELLVDYDNHTLHLKASDGNIYDVTGSTSIDIESLLEEIKNWISENTGDITNYFDFILQVQITVIRQNEDGTIIEEIYTLKEAIQKLFTELESIKIKINNIEKVINNFINEDGSISIKPGDIAWDDDHQPVSRAEKEAWNNKADIFQLIVIVPGGEDVWTATNDESPYTQIVEVPEMLDTDYPIVDVMLSNAYDTANTEIENYQQIYKIITYNGSIKLFAHAPTKVSLTLQMKIDR